MKKKTKNRDPDLAKEYDSNARRGVYARGSYAKVAEDLVLANADKYIRMRREARDAYRRGRTVPLDELTG
jgi:hypothetical protein